MTITRRKHRINKAKIRKLMVGNGEREGLLMRIVTYILLIAISFVFLYPILKMLSRSLMGPYDSANPLVDWIPTSLYLSNFSRAYQVLGGYKTILVSIGVMLLIAVVETLSSAVIAYGFAKFEFRGRMILFVLMLSTFLIPSQITFLPNYVMFNKYGMLQSIFPILIPSIFGQGIRQALFILIFYQFYRCFHDPFKGAVFCMEFECISPECICQDNIASCFDVIFVYCPDLLRVRYIPYFRKLSRRKALFLKESSHASIHEEQFFSQSVFKHIWSFLMLFSV